MITGSTAMAVEIESLRQQLATANTCLFQMQEAAKNLEQQLDDHLKREVVLREVLKESVTIVGRGLSIDVWTKGQEALADTDDLSVYILCERVPVAFFYEHAVTKETVLSRILDDESRKRGWKTTILYSAWEPK